MAPAALSVIGSALLWALVLWVLAALLALLPLLLLVVLVLLVLTGLTGIVAIHTLVGVFATGICALLLVWRVLTSHCRVSILRRIPSPAEI